MIIQNYDNNKSPLAAPVLISKRVVAVFNKKKTTNFITHVKRAHSTERFHVGN